MGLVVEKPLAGMPLEEQISLSDKWCGGKIFSADILEQDKYFEPLKEYHYRILLMSQYGSSFSDKVAVTSNLGKVEFIHRIHQWLLVKETLGMLLVVFIKLNQKKWQNLKIRISHLFKI